MRRRHKFAVVGSTLALVAAVATVTAVASVPDSSGVIHGCRNTTTGDMRVIDDATSSCYSYESPLNWNAGGGLSTYVLSDSNAGSGLMNVVANCTAGDLLLSAYTNATDSNSAPVTPAFQRDASNQPTGATWSGVRKPNSWTIICADM
jgi:hypothetical protein